MMKIPREYSFKLKCWPHEGFTYHFDCIDRFQPTSVYIDSIDPKFFFRGNDLAWNVNIIYYIILLVTTFIRLMSISGIEMKMFLVNY